MSALAGVVGGILGLVALDAVVTSKTAAGNLGTGFTALNKAASWFVDPTKPAISNHSTSSSSKTTTNSKKSTSSSATTKKKSTSGGKLKGSGEAIGAGP